MFRNKIVIIMALVFCFVCIISCGRDTSPPAEETKTVSSSDAEESVTHTLVEGETKTLSNEKYILHLTSGTIIREKSERMEYFLEKGKLLGKVEGDRDEFKVATPVAAIGIRGTEFSVSYNASTKTFRAASFIGALVITFGKEKREVTSRTALTVDEHGRAREEKKLSEQDNEDYLTLTSLPGYSRFAAAPLKTKGKKLTAGPVDTTFTLAFLMSAGGPSHRLDFEIYPSGSGKGDKKILYEIGAEKTITLKEGSYDIRYWWHGGEFWRYGLNVKTGGAKKLDVITECGAAKLNYIQAPGGSSHRLDFKIYPAGADEDADDILYDVGSSKKLILPAGAYDIRYWWHGGKGEEKNLIVTAGEEKTKDIITNCGTVELNYLQSPGGEPHRLDFKIYPAGADEDADDILYDVGSSKKLILPAGAYDIRYWWHGGKGEEKNLVIEAGSKKTVEIITASPK